MNIDDLSCWALQAMDEVKSANQQDAATNSNAGRPKVDGAKQAELAFRLYDKDKDGYITKTEMEKLSKTLTKEQIEKVFARFDADGDGRLSYAEFRKMMNK